MKFYDHMRFAQGRAKKRGRTAVSRAANRSQRERHFQFCCNALIIYDDNPRRRLRISDRRAAPNERFQIFPLYVHLNHSKNNSFNWIGELNRKMFCLVRIDKRRQTIQLIDPILTFAYKSALNLSQLLGALPRGNTRNYALRVFCPLLYRSV